MIIKILFTSILFFSIPTTYAVQCPSTSDWSHVPGQEWQLSDEAKAQGWEAISEPDAIDNPLKKLPPNKHLLVGVSTTEYKFTSCGYTLEKGNENNVIVALNTQNAVDIKKLQPPFSCRNIRCFCETTAGEPETCPWEWINKFINPEAG